MDGSQHTITRDGNGRFAPGCSGNPTGKLPGTRNRATRPAPAGDDNQEKRQDFSRADNELDHVSFPLFESDERDAAAPHVRWELSIPLVEGLHLEHFR